MDGLCLTSGAAVTAGFLFGLLCQTDSLGIVGGGFPLLKRDGTYRAGRQTIAQTVAVILPQQPGLAVHHADGAFVTGFGTQTAADTFIFINFNNFALHKKSSRFFLIC